LFKVFPKLRFTINYLNFKKTILLKHLFYLSLISILFASCKPTSSIVTSKTEKGNDTKYSTALIEQLIDSASENLGVKYLGGGTTKDGFDCSGLIYTTFKKFDITLPRSSADMAKTGTKINDNEIRKGDLIFFKTNGRSAINHVGIVIEVLDDAIKFIHSSTSSGVIISSTKEVYYSKNFVQANRIL
jgi:lipoprotein Spr